MYDRETELETVPVGSKLRLASQPSLVLDYK